MRTTDAFKFQIAINSKDATTEDLDELTREVLSELREADVELAELVEAGPAPTGTKAIDPVTVGAIAVTVIPTVLPKVIDMLQAWIARGSGRTVKFKGRIGKQQIEFEGPPEELQKLVDRLGKNKK